MPDLTNKKQAEDMLKAVAPELVEIKHAIDEASIPTEDVLALLTQIKNAKKTNITQKVVVNVDGGKVQTIHRQESESDAGYLHDAILNAGAKPIDVLRGMYLLANIRRYSKWGKVVYLMQDGKVVRVQQEQGYKLD